MSAKSGTGSPPYRTAGPVPPLVGLVVNDDPRSIRKAHVSDGLQRHSRRADGRGNPLTTLSLGGRNRPESVARPNQRSGTRAPRRDRCATRLL